LQNSRLEEVTWYIVASESQAPQFWLRYAEDQKAVDPSYSVSDLKDEIRQAGGGQEQAATCHGGGSSRCRWLRVYCEKLDRIVRPGQCPGCDVFPFIQEALR
jgi:hypothetical protein